MNIFIVPLPYLSKRYSTTYLSREIVPLDRLQLNIPARIIACNICFVCSISTYLYSRYILASWPGGLHKYKMTLCLPPHRAALLSITGTTWSLTASTTTSTCWQISRKWPPCNKYLPYLPTAISTYLPTYCNKYLPTYCNKYLPTGAKAVGRWVPTYHIGTTLYRRYDA